MAKDSRFSEKFSVNNEVLESFKNNGYIIVRGLLSQAELSKLKNALEEDASTNELSMGRDDSEGRQSRMLLWSHPGDDVTGMIGRCDKVVGSMESLLGGEVYHYHAKLIMKEAFTGGAFVWHQDYGYWYDNGNMYPDMGTVWIAVDKADKENGCVKLNEHLLLTGNGKSVFGVKDIFHLVECNSQQRVIPGSHKMGRINHSKAGDQMAADPERVKWAEDSLGVVHAEMEPGDAMFFHCNLLHRSEPNNSPNRRWGFLCCYNRASNNPIYEHFHPCYTPLTKVPNSAILECGDSLKDDGKDFMKIKGVSYKDSMGKTPH